MVWNYSLLDQTGLVHVYYLVLFVAKQMMKVYEIFFFALAFLCSLLKLVNSIIIRNV